MPNIHPDNARRAQVISLLREAESLSTNELAALMGTSPRMIQGCLQSMTADGILKSVRIGEGRKTVWQLTKAYQQDSEQLAPAIRRDFHNGVYTCPELRPFTGRPGAMDAYRLPSRGF